VFLALSLLEFGVGIYFLLSYLNAGRLGMTSLGPTWSGLTSYWFTTALRSLFFGIVTLFTTYLLLKKKKAGVWLAIFCIGLFFGAFANYQAANLNIAWV